MKIIVLVLLIIPLQKDSLIGKWTAPVAEGVVDSLIIIDKVRFRTYGVELQNSCSGTYKIIGDTLKLYEKQCQYDEDHEESIFSLLQKNGKLIPISNYFLKHKKSFNDFDKKYIYSKKI